MYDLTGLEAQGTAVAEPDRRPDQPDSRPARRPANRGDDRPRGHASDRVQLRAAHAAERLPALVQRGDCRVFRDARPPQARRVGAASAPSTSRGWTISCSISTPGRPIRSRRLIRDDRRFLDTKRSLDAYAEAWALTYFLLRQHPKEYVAYLGMLSKKKPLLQDDPDKRIDQFRQAFGELKDWTPSFCAT